MPLIGWFLATAAFSRTCSIGASDGRSKIEVMKRPVILISPDFSIPGEAKRERIQLNLEYQEAIAAAGGEPIVASPYTRPSSLCGIADGWLITGGRDLPGDMFGQATHHEAKLISERRIRAEQNLYKTFEGTDKPILGICFGMQFLAVTNRATLHQHLPEVVGHETHTDGNTRVSVAAGSRMESLGVVGEFEVGCYHHQAVDKPPAGWSVCATSQDGTVEAIEEDSGRWRFGVQWHPERTAESKQSKALFRSFVTAASLR